MAYRLLPARRPFSRTNRKGLPAPAWNCSIIRPGGVNWLKPGAVLWLTIMIGALSRRVSIRFSNKFQYGESEMKVYIEVGYDRTRALAHLLEYPGVCAQGTDAQQALEDVPTALNRFSLWLK